MIETLVLALFALQPTAPPPAEDFVDLVEVNHLYDETGKLVFDQAIFYDWCNCAGRHQVRAWRLVKNKSQLPMRDFSRGGYLSVWQDGDVFRSIHSHAYRETWTQWDVELAEREILPKEQRRGLGGER